MCCCCCWTNYVMMMLYPSQSFLLHDEQSFYCIPANIYAPIKCFSNNSGSTTCKYRLHLHLAHLAQQAKSNTKKASWNYLTGVSLLHKDIFRDFYPQKQANKKSFLRISKRLIASHTMHFVITMTPTAPWITCALQVEDIVIKCYKKGTLKTVRAPTNAAARKKNRPLS